MSISVAQIISSSASEATKFALDLKPSGSPGMAFEFSSGNIVFPAANCLTSEGMILEEDLDSHSGFSMRSTSVGGSLRFRIKSDVARRYDMWVRCRSSSASDISLMLGDVEIYNSSISSPSYTWIRLDVIFPDNSPLDFSLSASSSDVWIDKIVIKDDNVAPVDPSDTASPYVSIHARLFESSGLTPTTPTGSHDVINTIDHIVNRGWFNFKLEGTQPSGDFAIVLNTFGGDDDHVVSWMASSGGLPSLSNSGLGWSFASTPLKVRAWSWDPAVKDGCIVTTPSATLEYHEEKCFDVQDINNLLVVPDDIYDLGHEYDPYLGEGGDFDASDFATCEYGQDIRLDMGPRVVSLVLDQSGSMTWNDSSGKRHEIALDLVNLIQQRYPSDVRFNLFTVAGEESFSFSTVLPRRVNSNEVGDIIRAHFEGDPLNFAGIRVVRKESGYPESAIDGEIVFDGYGMGAIDEVDISGPFYYKIFTYDQSNRFSDGVEIYIPSASAVRPMGVASIEAKTFIGYDQKIDDDTIALWHMDEQEGVARHRIAPLSSHLGTVDFPEDPVEDFPPITSKFEPDVTGVVFDFAPDGKYMQGHNLTRLVPFDSPSGVGGVRLNGENAYMRTDGNVSYDFLTSDSDFTFSAWIQPMSAAASQPVFTISNDTTVFLKVELNSLTPVLIMNGTHTASSPLTLDQWNHLTITYSSATGTATFYIDGVSSGTSSASHPGDLGITNYSATIGHDPTSPANFFFGAVKSFYLYSSLKTDSEVLNIATPPVGWAKGGVPVGADNGDRCVGFFLHVPTDITANHLRVVMNRQSPPKHISDGEIVYDGELKTRRWLIDAPSKYDVARFTYFRFFTRDDSGNWSPFEDSTRVDVWVPDIDRQQISVTDAFGNTQNVIPGPGFGSGLPVPDTTGSRPGREKSYIKWTFSDNDDISRVRIYHGTGEDPPYYDNKSRSIVGSLIWDGVKSINEFVHRRIENNTRHHYVVVTVNRFGQFSNFAELTFVPDDAFDDTGIPLLEVSNARATAIDSNRVRIRWDSPVDVLPRKTNYFDEQVFIYAAVCDLEGNPIPLTIPENLTTTTRLNRIDREDIEDAFDLVGDDQSIIDGAKVSTSTSPSGLITGTARIDSGGAFATVESVQLNILWSYSFGPGSTVDLPTLSVSFENPLSLRLTNRDRLFIRDNSCDLDDDSDAGFGSLLNGIYIRKSSPITIRGFVTFKGEAVNSSDISVRIFDANIEDCLPKLDSVEERSSTVFTTKNNFVIEHSTEEIKNWDGSLIQRRRLSHVDIPISAPDLPQSASVFVRVRHRGQVIVKRFRIRFPTILQLSVTGDAPETNGVDVREQSARAWLIDPDDPQNPEKITFVSDLTICRFEMQKEGETQRTVPFYSTDSVPLVQGVFSYFRNGTARNIYFGPAASSAAGEYILIASLTYEDLYAEASTRLVLSASGTSGFDFDLPDPGIPRILLEGPEPVNYVWADGRDFVKLAIVRKPGEGWSLSGTDPVPDPAWQSTFHEAFVKCSLAATPQEPVLNLSAGQRVSIQAEGFDIYHGAVNEIVTSQGIVLDTSNALGSENFADINLSTGDFTYIWLKRSKPVDPPRGCVNVNAENPCDLITLPSRVCARPERIGDLIAVSASSKINYSGQPTEIKGGGPLATGRPPVCIVPMEPLRLEYVGAFANGNLLDQWVFDSVTPVTVISEGWWKGEPMPDGVEFDVTLTGSPEDVEGIPLRDYLGIPEKTYTRRTTNHPTLGSGTQEFSLLSLTVNPLSPDISVAFSIVLTTKYTGD